MSGDGILAAMIGAALVLGFARPLWPYALGGLTVSLAVQACR